MIDHPAWHIVFAYAQRWQVEMAITIEVELNVTQADKIMAGILNIPVGHRIIQLKRVRAIEGGVIIGYSINSFPFTRIYICNLTQARYFSLEIFGSGN